jgi:hypothetical protein
MHPELAEYLECIDPEDLGNLDAVEASWLEAQRIMSPQGLENYLVGIKAMCTLGKGQDLVGGGEGSRRRHRAGCDRGHHETVVADLGFGDHADSR